MTMQGSLKLTPLIKRHAVTVIINKLYTSDAMVKLMRSGYNVKLYTFNSKHCMKVRLTCCRKIAAAPAVTTREGHRYWDRTIDVHPILHGLDHVTGWCNSWPTEYILFLTFNNYHNVISWKYTESVCILKERSKSVLRKINLMLTLYHCHDAPWLWLLWTRLPTMGHRSLHMHLNNHKCAVCNVTRMSCNAYSAQSTYVGSQTIFIKSLDHPFANNEGLLMESEEVAVLVELKAQTIN